MDIDDTGLMTQLRSLCTSDRESMIREFIQIIGEHKVTVEEAKFYLEMNAWTLSDAIGAFYDNGQQNTQIADFVADFASIQQGSLGMTLIQDINPDETVPPNTLFIKRFLMKNTGPIDWPAGCELRFVDGTMMQQQDAFAVPQVQASGEYEICIPMISPLEDGSYQSQWRLYTPMDWSFGDSVFCIVNVDSNLKDYVPLDPVVRVSFGEFPQVQGPLNFASFFSQDGTSARPTTPNNDNEETME